MKKKKAIVILSLAILLIAALAFIYFVFLNKGQSAQAELQEYWPDGDWRTSTPEEQGMDSAVLADMVGSIKESDKNLNSITIIRHGYLVNETYFYPYQKGITHAVNSCTKSFISALTGITVEEGGIESIDNRVLEYFSDLDIANVEERKQKLKIQNLLSMTTGFEWQIDGNVSTNNMMQSSDWTKFTLDLPMSEEPGLTFNYCNGAANVMSSIVQKTTGKSASDLFAERFKALGIKDMYWSSSPENTSLGYSGIFMHPDDAAKFGYLYLKNGNWNKEQLIPKAWIEESTKLQAKANWTPAFPGYGYMWWVTRFGGYAAMGYGGNYIFVVPDMDLVVVITGGMFNNTDLFYPADLMENYIIPSVKSDTALESNSETALSLSTAVDAAQNAPAPKPVTLPDIALLISDKTYLIDGLGTVVFHFEEGSNEFIFDLNSQTFTAGLDGMFRIIDVGSYGSLPDHNHYALKGNWLDQDTIQIEIRSLEDGFVQISTADFEGDSIKINNTSNLGVNESYSGTIQQ